ncbi:MAG: DUF6176 family protein [Peptostreptococcaceae bacterium]|nr:DUF6176 family protein [Peptostreptococcaceae bacterium]
MKTEMVRFKVKEGKMEKAREWIAFLNENMPAVLETLEGERMYVEVIFSEKIHGEDYLYWFSVQGEGGIQVQDSEHWIDKKHLAYWDECIDPDFKPQWLTTEVVMIPERICTSMEG